MQNKDIIFNKIAEALLVDYTSVYYVNAVTNEYQWYSLDPEFHSLPIESHGTDFFKNLVYDADKVVYEEDKHIFMKDLTKENLLSQMNKGTMQSVEYRLVIDGVPVWHQLRLIRGIHDDDDEYFILGILNIDANVKKRDEAEKASAERNVFNQIASSLAEHYDTLYYVDIETDHYFEFSSTDRYKNLNIPTEGDDFFAECIKNGERIIHEDDRSRVISYFKKENMIRHINDNHTFQREYKLLLDGEILNMRMRQLWASDRKHAIVCLENIDDELKVQREYRESQKRSNIYMRIAETLASHYDIIYYVDSANSHYIEFSANKICGNFELQETGTDFFTDCIKNGNVLLYPKDKERVFGILNKDRLITLLDDSKQFSIDYRMVVDKRPVHTRMTIMWSSDMIHFIIGVQNIDELVKKEKQQSLALRHANDLARRDELTGVKNNFAWREFSEIVQENIDNGINYLPFAIVVCDVNHLQAVNKEEGHKTGDEYIRAASRLICNVFTHSPVFRIDDDEFAAFLGSGDYSEREALFDRLNDQIHLNISSGDGPVFATGMADYDINSDRKILDILARAQKNMADEKKKLSAGFYARVKTFEPIPDERKRKLQGMFDAFSLVAEGAYVYICDMKYDFSIWSRAAVDAFGLSSQYIYEAGLEWEKHVHPEDRETYHAGISDIFTGNASGHDMQYRAKKLNGGYDLCTCRGIVLRDSNGKPEYFCGAIRNHGIQGHVDTLTGLRNQYGFFEDIQSNMIKHTDMNIVMIGIGRFSEINEVYGYQFGNRILQKFGRYLFDHIGNSGSVYRLDGTKFAVISKTKNDEELCESYTELRGHFRKGFSLEGKFVILDLNAGMLTVDNYDIDHQTVYACLNFAYGESKLRRQGEMVEFYNDINDENRHRIEKLYAIRASIMQNYKGFYLLYQPVVDAATEKLIGAEALLRWRSEEYGMVPPDHFIPILEKDPLFCNLGQWILRTAINGAKLIMEEHPDFVVNVNLSYTQLERPDFVDMVLKTLREEGFSPEHLCMEITERCRLLDMYLLKNVIVNLRARGIKIALDDFGTGFSSVGLVKNLPFDTIKIDRSFVLKIEEDPKERELIKSFAGVASTFGAKVCVEGIETEGMRDILQNFNIQSFQGYYYAKPLELRDFIIWQDKLKNK